MGEKNILAVVLDTHYNKGNSTKAYEICKPWHLGIIPNLVLQVLRQKNLVYISPIFQLRAICITAKIYQYNNQKLSSNLGHVYLK